MISDILSDAHAGMREWLDTSDVYTGAIRSRIERCMEEMDAIRCVLDTPPDTSARPAREGAE